MPTPTNRETLLDVARLHFREEMQNGQLDEKAVKARIEDFLQVEGKLDRATDQLLNALHLLSGPEDQRPGEDQVQVLQDILFKQLNDAS